MTEKETKTMLITGAAGGIGRATVKVFAEHGWRVFGVDRQPKYDEFPADGVYIQADISLPEQIEGIYAKVKAETDSLDAVVNNAAVQIAKPLVETTAEEWDLTIASNLRSAFLGAKLAYPLLKAKGGWGDREYVLRACCGDLGEYRGLCRQQGRPARTDPGDGD